MARTALFAVQNSSFAKLAARRGGIAMNFSKIIARARQVLLAPKTEWPVIAAEPDTTAGIYRNYILVLAAITPIAGFIRTSVIGYRIPLVGMHRVDVGAGLVGMLVSYGLALATVYVFALIINALAPNFGGQKDPLLALKTAAYATTAAWVAGIGQMLPGVGGLILLAGGIYSVYLLYLALPTTMKCPPEKAVAYTAVSVVAAIVLFGIAAAIVGGVIGHGVMGPW
jgi:hypothetical protein